MKRPICLLFVCIGICCIAADKKSADLPRSTPEKQGISSAAVLDFVEAADKRQDIHSFMLLRHGRVVAEGWWSPYGAEIPHMLFSLSKSFTSTAVGLAIAEGRLSLDDEVLKFFPEDAPADPGGNLRSMRVRDLLSMSTGQHSNDVAKFSFQSNTILTKLFLSLPVEHKPGTFFHYNTPATYMQSAIVQKVTGTNVLEYLGPRLFEPLGIENPTWGSSPQGITLGGYGLKIKTEDIARFGQLYLQKGQWNGRQLVPASWIEVATARQVSNGSNPASDWEQGYGYQFWRCRHGLYRADGAFGQFCIVMPEQDAVIAITSGTRDMQGVMNLVWDKLLPAMQSDRLPADKKTRQKLESKLAGLALHPVSGNFTSPVGAQASSRKYSFPTNDQNIEAVTFDFVGPEATLIFRSHGTEHRIACGYNAWRTGRTSLTAGLNTRVADPVEQPVAGSVAWTADDTYTAKLAFYETPLVITFTFRFAGDQLFLDQEYNVSFGATKRPQLVGQAQ